MLKRAETAQAEVNHCFDNKIPLKHYEIEFFDRTGSIKFMEEKINSSHNAVISECIDGYYEMIKQNFLKRRDVTCQN